MPSASLDLVVHDHRGERDGGGDAVQHAVPADLVGGAGRRSGRKAEGRVGDKNPARDQPHAVGADQQRSPGSSPARVQRPPQPDGERAAEQAAHDEVGDLYPSQWSQAEQADRVPAEVEPVTGERLYSDRDDEYRTGGNPAGAGGTTSSQRCVAVCTTPPSTRCCGGWRQLQRFTGRRELLPETVDAVAGLVSDRMITW